MLKSVLIRSRRNEGRHRRKTNTHRPPSLLPIQEIMPAASACRAVVYYNSPMSSTFEAAYARTHTLIPPIFPQQVIPSSPPSLYCTVINNTSFLFLLLLKTAQEQLAPLPLFPPFTMRRERKISSSSSFLGREREGGRKAPSKEKERRRHAAPSLASSTNFLCSTPKHFFIPHFFRLFPPLPRRRRVTNGPVTRFSL